MYIAVYATTTTTHYSIPSSVSDFTPFRVHRRMYNFSWLLLSQQPVSLPCHSTRARWEMKEVRFHLSPIAPFVLQLRRDYCYYLLQSFSIDAFARFHQLRYQFYLRISFIARKPSSCLRFVSNSHRSSL